MVIAMLNQQSFEMLLSCIIFNCGPNQWAPLGETSLSFCPWKSMKNLGKKKFFPHGSVCLRLPPTECLFIKECALTLNQVLRWRPWLSVKFLSGPFYLSLVQSDSYFTYTEVWDKGYMWMDLGSISGSLNISV